MMENINLYSIDYYKKTVFKGSYRGVCFRISRYEPPTSTEATEDDGAFSGGDEATEVLRVKLWKGPYILEKTDEEVHTRDFEYTDEGLGLANEWIEDMQAEICSDEAI